MTEENAEKLVKIIATSLSRISQELKIIREMMQEDRMEIIEELEEDV